MFFATIEELEEATEADHEVGEELAPGVWVERRTILKLGLTAFAGAFLPNIQAKGPIAPNIKDPIDYNAFVAEVQPLAEALIKAQVPNEAKYLDRVQQLVRRVTPLPAATFKKKRPVEMFSTLRTPPLVIYQIRMAPGAMLKLHDHRQYNGVLFGMQGQAACRNFDLIDPESVESSEDFQIRETSKTILKPGVTSSLSRTRNNLHELKAGPEGAQLFDVFTFFSPKARSAWLEFNDKPVTAAGNVYSARWR